MQKFQSICKWPFNISVRNEFLAFKLSCDSFCKQNSGEEANAIFQLCGLLEKQEQSPCFPFRHTARF